MVAKIKIACSGGSSNVFNKALKAPIDNICTSSIMYTLYFNSLGTNDILFFNSRISSTPLLLAASISIMSIQSLEKDALQRSHLPQAIPSLGSKQLTFLANILDTVVLPVPRGPKNIYACEKF